MTLGERIGTLRTQKNLSQSRLADELGVSRQSVSKWETDVSTPELEKLIGMCEVFRVTMDYLVRGEEPEEHSAPEMPIQTAACQGHTPIRKILGLILLAAGLLLAILIAIIWEDVLAGLIMLLPFGVCGVLCLYLEKPGLWCGWSLYLMIVGYLPKISIFRLRNAFEPYYYQTGYWLPIAEAWIGIVLGAGLAVWSIVRWRARRQRKEE